MTIPDGYSSQYYQSGLTGEMALARLILLLILAAPAGIAGCDGGGEIGGGDMLNDAPAANAGPDQSVLIGATVQLDGSGSTDSGGDALIYSWSFLSLPSASGATLSGANSVVSSFTVDVPGEFVVELRVSDGILNSADTCTISTANTAPVANAGPDQTIRRGTLVQLDGSASYDADNNPLFYAWTIVSAPHNSAASLDNDAIVNPVFVASVAGTYVVRLVVNDSFEDSAPDTVQIDTVNSAPVANAGPDQEVFVGDDVSLDGRASSDADRDPLGYQWVLLTTPDGSLTTLRNPDRPLAAFVADLEGAYVAQLIVNDGRLDSDPDTALIMAGSATSGPVARRSK